MVVCEVLPSTTDEQVVPQRAALVAVEQLDDVDLLDVVMCLATDVVTEEAPDNISSKVRIISPMTRVEAALT